MEFSKWLLKTGMSRYAMGKLSGVHENTVAKIANNESVHVSSLKKLIRATAKHRNPLTMEHFQGSIKAREETMRRNFG